MKVDEAYMLLAPIPSSEEKGAAAPNAWEKDWLEKTEAYKDRLSEKQLAVLAKIVKKTFKQTLDGFTSAPVSPAAKALGTAGTSPEIIMTYIKALETLVDPAIKPLVLQLKSAITAKQTLDGTYSSVHGAGAPQLKGMTPEEIPF